MPAPDRLTVLLAQDVVYGLDFVYVDPDQQTLEVFLLVPPKLRRPLAELRQDQVRIYSTGEPDVELLGPPVFDPADSGESGDSGEDRLRLRMVAARPGGFARYRLRIDDERVDPYYNDIEFSFKAGCESRVDCRPPAHECPPEAPVDFAVDTLAHDFASFRQALLEFASQRYPDWHDRLEADVGMMLVEVMSALGDEMAYYQDRVAREGALETATQRRSLRHHARLVDYPMHDGAAACCWLDVQVQASASGEQPLLAGSPIHTAAEGSARTTFEMGRGLVDIDPRGLATRTYTVNAARNALQPHVWDEHARCLPVGATSLHVRGHHQAALAPLAAPSGQPPGRWVLLCTNPTDPSVPVRRWLVRLIEAVDEADPLLNDPKTGHAVTRLRWEEAQATPFELDLELLTVHGNLVPATAGRTERTLFAIGPSPSPEIASAVERTGPGGSIAYRFTLPDPQGEGLVFLGDDPRSAQPELRLAEVVRTEQGWAERQLWTFRRSLLGARSSQSQDPHFTLEDGTWARVVGFQRPPGELVHVDYLDGTGLTLRFGDGEFGKLPAVGTIFQLTYRLGNGPRSNVAAGTLTVQGQEAPFVEAVMNPLPATGGIAPESMDEVKQSAPELFRGVTYRAVRPEDYAEAAGRLPWVQRAGGALRWTGSWLSAFVTVDPRGADMLSEPHRQAVELHLDRFRQAGREVHVLPPIYADIELEIQLCVLPHFYRDHVVAAVTEALVGRRGAQTNRHRCFFDPDNFTFGTPLDRSELEAAIQRVGGVRAVGDITIRRRGWFDWRPFTNPAYWPAANEVIRLESDPRHPERGSLKIVPKGGA